MTLGDLNFSSPSSRSVKPTTSKVAKQTSEAPIHHHAIGEPHDYEKWDRDPCSNQGFRPGINDDEYAFAKTSWIKPGILDVVTYRAHAVGKCTHSPDKPGWMQTPDELDYCAKLRHTAELPGWNQQAARRKNQYIRATLDYILVNKVDLATRKEREQTSAMVKALNTRAKVFESEFGKASLVNMFNML